MLETLADGTKIQRNTNGIIHTTQPDGVTIQENPDGTKIKHLPDGTSVNITAEGGAEHLVFTGKEVDVDTGKEVQWHALLMMWLQQAAE